MLNAVLTFTGDRRGLARLNTGVKNSINGVDDVYLKINVIIWY